jgi:predicted ribosome quality control (RQC) complex YloA/Tae2 family protein
MSDRPTPETDSIIRNAQTADHPPTRLAATLTVKCGKLERERDEAREKAERYRIEANAIMMQRDEWAAMCGRYKQERDESQEKYATEATEHMLAVNKICNERDEARTDLEFRRGLYKVQEQYLETARRERDEARAALMRIEDLFIDGTDIYADREKMGMIARSALEETK